MNEITPDEHRILVDAIQDSATVVHKGRMMNERIKKLAEQAKKYALDTMIKITVKEQALKVYSESYDTKFAELIVRECAEIADTAEPFLSSDLIKQHFGVKE